jgi:putative nucleotidyltransferase with HDIG domain
MLAPRSGVVREDPVRALRVARFAAQFPGFSVARPLRREAKAARAALERASVERLRDEMNRLLEAPAPQRGLRLLRELGLVDAVLPELEPLRGCAAGLGRSDVWSHTLEALSRSARAARLPGAFVLREPDGPRLLRWALLLHDISKPETLSVDRERPTFHGHEVIGARRAEALLRRMRMPRSERRRIVRLVLLHLRPSHLADAGAPPRGMRRLVRDAAADLPLLALHAACDAKASQGPGSATRWRRLRSVLLALLELGAASGGAPPPALVDGRDVMRVLGLPPGPRVGRVLERVRDGQESGEIRSRAEALAYLARLPE